MRYSWWIGAWVAVNCAVIFAQGSEPPNQEEAVSAQSPVDPEQATPAEAAPAKPDRPSTLVMHSLDVVEGVVLQREGVFRVQVDDGVLVIPAGSILFECGSREEAYLLLKPRVLPNNAADHISLAKWCIKNELLEQAQEEVQAAVRLNPDNEENRFMMKYVDELLNPYRIPEDAQGYRRDRFNLAESFLKEAEPLGGMTRSQAREFTSRVQPILLNSCATARCHRVGNPDTEGFHLKPLGGYQSLQVTEFNLEQIQKQLDRREPYQSPLLRAHRQTDGPIRSPFDKPQGEHLERTILSWIISLDEPESDPEAPMEAGQPRNANIVSTITRDRNRRKRRQEMATKSRAKPSADSPIPNGSEDFLSTLLDEDETQTAAE